METNMNKVPEPQDRRHPATEHLLQFFTYTDLPPHLQLISWHSCGLASIMVQLLPDGPELTVGLRKLLEAKDSFVRAALTMQEARPHG